MKNTLFVLLAVVALSACQTERNDLVVNANETIYVQSEGASMRVNLRGNLASKVVMLVVHGGPGGASYFYRAPAVLRLEEKYAVAYWDQRVAGASQGNTAKGSVVMAQYGEDLKKVILTLRHKYGQDLQVFLMGQSWGGMVCAQFMTEGDNQEMVSGWISANATHNWALNDSLTRAMLLEFGTEQIGLGKNVEKWQEIVDYCLANPGKVTVEMSAQLNFYAWQALGLIEGFTSFDANEILRQNLISEKIPYTQAFLNMYNPANGNLNNSVVEVEFSSRLFRVTRPVLALSGRYDFVVPEGLAIDLINKVQSAVKERKLFLMSGHNLEEQEAYVDAFIQFIDENK